MTTAYLDIFEGNINTKPVAWHEISHDGYNWDYPGFGFWLCDTLLGKKPPKTVKELSGRIWKSGFAYHMKNSPSEDPFFNLNEGPFTIDSECWNEDNNCAYRVIHHSDGSWEVLCASDSKDERTLVENWKWKNSTQYKKEVAAKEKASLLHRKKLDKVAKELLKIANDLVKKNGCDFKEVMYAFHLASSKQIYRFQFPNA